MSDCFEWHGSTNGRGYGVTYVDRKQWRVHRLAYTMTKGEIPEGMVVMHLCHNPLCCNPDHLEAGTQKENMQMSLKAGRLTGRKGHSRRLINRCLTLRKDGKMLKEISAFTGVPIATISNWCRGYTTLKLQRKMK